MKRFLLYISQVQVFCHNSFWITGYMMCVFEIPNISGFKEHLQDIEVKMKSPGFYSDRRSSAGISKEHQKIMSPIDKEKQVTKLINDIRSAEQMLDDDSVDDELKEFAKEELESSEKDFEKIRHDMLLLMPPEASNSRNTVF